MSEHEKCGLQATSGHNLGGWTAYSCDEHCDRTDTFLWEFENRQHGDETFTLHAVPGYPVSETCEWTPAMQARLDTK